MVVFQQQLEVLKKSEFQSKVLGVKYKAKEDKLS